MKLGGKFGLVAVTLAGALTSTASFGQGLPTTGTIESPIGPLEIKNGYPTEQTVTKLYDALDFQRATQAYLWALPYMAMTEWQRWTREEFGAGNLGYVDYVDFKDKLGILTPTRPRPMRRRFPIFPRPDHWSSSFRRARLPAVSLISGKGRSPTRANSARTKARAAST